ncbi:hypothetical protein SEA_SYDNAT_63 [Mycobacterium phage SydNat]|nr:hypothetical protein KIP50_gp29 [Mycobacterium phage Zolita]YP_010060940.1 hypothetical protein KIP51_gp29 [Mycobacterium phage Bluefalcon]UVK64282.1 hypothetical protein SEA_SYDNAT_63 [Mycobacterium phage SydNat]UVK64369.1 membrane protein [Mycobacterium phage Ghoulboy]QDK03145.1 hypothetical protein SEA_ZOLITA_62 [Mycobacterium phage Zolita]QGH75404.1 hypothetical protein SEA_BLUEFALCON_59 [Mycobacterium phage Bluefalcon]
MKKIITTAVIAAAAAIGMSALTGCSKASTSEDRFSVEYIDGAKCIIYAPYNDSGNGIQMECDFR